MTNDAPLVPRRFLLRTAAVLGAAVTTRLLTADPVAEPGGPLPAAGPPPAAGPGAAVPAHPDHRLRPLAGYAAPEASRRLPTPVRTKPVLRMPGDAHPMVLTFDDGPDPRWTPPILDLLRRHHVRATFFVCGEMAENQGGLLRRMVDEGHVIGNHSWSHPLLTRASTAVVRAELERTSEAVERAVGQPPQWMRAPYGAWNRRVFRLGAELGMDAFAWTVDSLDWKEPGTRTIIDQVLGGAGPGVIVLAHDAGGDRSQTVTALRTWLPRLLADGHRFTVPVRGEV
ncbi:polysaccharide deacetylase family protein [Streptomyces sp. KE1]|uniref:polysaccharide deacetylase family protein n=1 Tax=Streptomyces sp. KE1 TaxID=1638939 RepID=UPI00063E7275|nr:polysaccharide deacetylase family protein [Streptomyces sp. KE1]KLJ03650.1 oligosaccharide deacetylase [Streptomyces sp. KE1]